MPNAPQQVVAAIQIPSPPLITPHTPSTRASAGLPIPKPPWLLPNRLKLNRPARSSSDLGNNLRPTTRTDPARSCAPETSEPAPQDASSSVSVSESASMDKCSPPTERSGKRKAEYEAPPRDKEPRLASSAVKGRGGAMYIDEDEGERIMKKSDILRRTKRAAPSVDDNGVFLFPLWGLRELCARCMSLSLLTGGLCLAPYRHRYAAHMEQKDASRVEFCFGNQR